MKEPLMDTGDFAEVPADERSDSDSYDPDDYGGVPDFGDEPEQAR